MIGPSWEIGKSRIRRALQPGLFDPVAHRSHSCGSASLGILQSPRGERLTVPTLGPSGTQERLYCWLKNRVKKVRIVRSISPRE